MATAYPGGLRKRGGLLDYEDTIQATPRNPFFGGVADLLGQAYKLPEMPRLTRSAELLQQQQQWELQHPTCWRQKHQKK